MPPRTADRCDECGDRMWKARGPGTEWITQEVRKLLPGFPVYRLDRDHQGSQPDVAFADPARQDRRVESDAVIDHLQDSRTGPAVQPDVKTRGARVLVRVRQ